MAWDRRTDVAMPYDNDFPYDNMTTNQPQQSPLTVYKASAGSGKTFTLALEYIKLLISDPQNYRYTLAVTFTNKATNEMKTRILSQLYGISNALADSDDYMQLLQSTFPRLTPGEIRDRAGLAMNLILHHYHYFRVETIDSFFQSILRNLARELGLPANLQVGLNDKDVESEAVDHIIENIDKDNDPLLTWIMDFVSEKIRDEKNWNVIGQIKDFGQNIFTDFYKSHQEELARIMHDTRFFSNYTSRLRELKVKADKTMADVADEFFNLAEQHQLAEADFSRGCAFTYFRRLREGNYANDKNFPASTILASIDDATKLIKKADIEKVTGQTIMSEVAPLIRRAEEQRQQMMLMRHTVELTLGNINELRLLGRIEEEVRSINQNNSSFLLSNTQQLLRQLIGRQDSPFIYEKIGGQLRFIMIDEFQDTSTVQWENFKVLLDDCLAHNNGSLIVGDVKQSIYRWRGGDWQLLQNLTPEHDPRVEVRSLDVNYRSHRNIIRFNNIFFSIAAKVTADDAVAELEQYGATEPLLDSAREIRRAYADVRQQVGSRHREDPENQAGGVTVKLLPADEYDERTIAEVKQCLENLLASGIEPRRIAILVRSNSQIQDIATYFQQNAITVKGENIMVSMVSDEAFRLDASLAVRTIVQAMHLLEHPDDRLATAALVKAYYSIGHAEINDGDNDTHLFVAQEDIRSLLPEEMLSQWDDLIATPLIDLAERLYRIFGLSRLDGQSAYVCAFFDELADFTQHHIAGIDEFVEEWNSVIAAKSIHSDEVNGIRLLTVHKSKGLEFDNIIMPYCDWDVEKNGETKWMETPHAEPFGALPVVPMGLSARKMQTSLYAPQYQSEHLKNLVDNLNLLYVAFTRARTNLFVFGRVKNAKYPSTLISQVIHYEGADPTEPYDPVRPSATPDGTPLPRVKLADLLPGHFVNEAEDGTLTFTFGQLCLPEHEAEEQTANVFRLPSERLFIAIRNYETQVTFRQSNDSKTFVLTEEEQKEQERRQQYLDTGNVLHTILASIKDRTEIGKAIEKMEFSGVLYNKPMTREQLTRLIEERLSLPQVAEWFDPKWQVFNECNILHYDEAAGRAVTHRPDRVIYDGNRMIVIDLKTGRQQKEHHGQVRQYMQLLREMGYPNVSGYLWYIRTNQVVSVEDLLL